MNFRQKSFFCFFILTPLLLVSFYSAKAADFDPSYLISDTEMTNYNALDASDIVNFLAKRPGTLSSYIAVDKEGNFKTAAQTFYEVAQKWMINPKYLLVLVQKEQSLLDDTSPSQGQYDRATGYGCPDSGGCDDRWKGFYKQVNSAAAQTRYYQDNIREFNFRPGETYPIDDQTVTIKNTATAGLFNYTPHIHGNLLFWNLWNKYFSKKWPDGSLLRAAGSEKVYLIENDTKRDIISKSVFVSRFSEAKVVEVAPEDIASYEEGVPIKFLNFSLLKDSSGNIFMIVDDQKRKIESPEVFKKIGFMEDEVTTVSDVDLAVYENGPNISQYTIYPAGALLSDSQTKKLYFVLSGQKRLVVNKEIQDYNFQGMTIKKVSSDELDSLSSGDPMTLPEGELVKVKGVNTVYVISNGKRLPIFSGEIFEHMNYAWKNVKTIQKQTLEVHPVGQTITGAW